ncbi:hypothetical protein [Pseudanabaena sp. SR411]|uniref:hypothetical protein n=1 Tax=Pseudanabaena sp. SR411 TaxID=1980935 RepID=UPI001C3E3AB5|nr:hypothetical protein [Pseudanabaena sp. SR411]
MSFDNVIVVFSLVLGYSAWQREFIGKRKIELAETVLAKFYEVEDAIREIRNQFPYINEGQSRKRSDYETEKESQLLDRTYVVFERYQKREKLFAELRALKYRFMANFGSQSGESFKELDKVLNEIFISAHMLGKHYWPRQGRVAMSEDEFQKHLHEMHKHEAIFWCMGEDEDTISPRVRSLIQNVENITRDTVRSNSGISIWMSLFDKVRHNVAKTYQSISSQDHQQIQTNVSPLLEQPIDKDVNSLRELMDKTSDRAKERGLTPEILESILNEH